MAGILENAYNENDVPVQLSVHLEHQYTEASLRNLGLRALKGKDHAIADAFTSANSVLEQRGDGSDLSINIASCTQVRTLACDDLGG